MTRRVPTRRCRKCVRYDGHACHLDDLQPCDFIRTPEAENELAGDIFLVVATVAVLGFLALTFCCC